MTPHPALRFALPVLLATAAASDAFADDIATCLDAASKGQRLRHTHKLLEAREQLKLCAAAECPTLVRTDCAGWLADAEAALPSVVFAAKNAEGEDLLDVKVSVDGALIAPKLDGVAVSIDAGPHAFHFEASDGRAADRTLLVKEGEHNLPVTVTFAPPPTVTTVAPPPNPAAAPASSVPSPGAGGSSRPWRTLGWVLAGAGVAGLGVATGFGILAIGDKSAAVCDPSGLCNGPVGPTKTAALVSDIGWISGGVLLASGLSLVLFGPGPSSPARAASSVRAVPYFAEGGGGMIVRGSF
jgi:hypothetical protein